MSFEAKLLNLTKLPFVVRWNENTSVFLRSQKIGGVLHLHMHRLFQEAPTPVLEAILRFSSKKDRQALAVIRQMADLYFSKHFTDPVILSEQGSSFDLRTIYNKVETEYYKDRLNLSIGWSKRYPPKNFRSITFGSYDRQRRQIRINPILDDPRVPLYFLEFIVYHEMLHAICPPIIGFLGRVNVHTSAFKEKERQFAQFQEAKKWAKIFMTRRVHGRA